MTNRTCQQRRVAVRVSPKLDRAIQSQGCSKLVPRRNRYKLPRRRISDSRDEISLPNRNGPIRSKPNTKIIARGHIQKKTHWWFRGNRAPTYDCPIRAQRIRAVFADFNFRERPCGRIGQAPRRVSPSNQSSIRAYRYRTLNPRGDLGKGARWHVQLAREVVSPRRQAVIGADCHAEVVPDIARDEVPRRNSLNKRVGKAPNHQRTLTGRRFAGSADQRPHQTQNNWQCLVSHSSTQAK